jgi:hypothetical protein
VLRLSPFTSHSCRTPWRASQYVVQRICAYVREGPKGQRRRSAVARTVARALALGCRGFRAKALEIAPRPKERDTPSKGGATPLFQTGCDRRLIAPLRPVESLPPC